MAYAPDSVGFTYGDGSILGQFQENEWDFPHLIWVSHDAVGQWNARYGKVLKTVCYIAVDENDDGTPMVEKWNITKHRTYTKN